MHGRCFAFDVVGVLVVLAVVELFHELGGGIAQVEGDGFGGVGFDVGADLAVGGVDGVGFGCEGEVDDGLGEGEFPFGGAEEVHGVAGGEAEVEGFGGGEANVFDRHADDAAGDVHRVLTGGQHAGEPVESGVGVGVADRFVEGGDKVVVLLALFVVEEDALLEGFRRDGLGDVGSHFVRWARCARGSRFAARNTGVLRLRAAPFAQDDATCGSATDGKFGSDFEGVEGIAGVAGGVRGDGFEDAFVGGQVEGSQAPFGVGEGTVEEGDDLWLLEGAEGVDAAAGEERGVDLEAGVLGGGANEADAAALDVGEEGVLLGLVETMDLVDEEDGAGAKVGGLFGFDHDLLDFFYAGEDGGEFDEAGGGDVGDDLGKRGFADAGRAPEDERGGVVIFDLQAERFAGCEEMGLAEEFVERAGSHALGERGALAGGVGGDVGGEEAHSVRDSESRIRDWRMAS